MLRASSRFFIGLLLATAAGVIFWRLSLHPTSLLVGPQHNGGNDVTSQFIAFRDFQGRALAQSQPLPSWNPFSLGGTPWLGCPQSAMFYPPNWLYGLIGARQGISWMLVLHHWLAGLGTFLLCRRYELSKPAALFAGICFLGAPYYVAQTGEGHYNQVCLVAWIPWAFLMLERLRRGQRWGVPATAAVLALTFFCGHVQEMFYLVLLITGFLAVDIVKGVRPRSRTVGSGEIPDGAAVRLLGRWLLVGAVVAGLTAIELLPMWLYSRHCVRAGGMAIEQVSGGSLALPSLLQLFDPFAFGGPADYRGPGQYYWEALCHFGLVPLVFAIAAVCSSSRRYPVLRLAVLWLAALLFALGSRTPLFPLLHRLVPGVALFREPSRMLFFCSFFTAVLAGAGFDQMVSAAADGRRRWQYGALIGLVIAIVAAVVLTSLQRWRLGPIASAESSSGLGWQAALQAMSVARVFGWLLGALFVMFLLSLGPRFSKYAIAVGLCVVCAELGWHAGRILRTIPADAIRRDNSLLVFLRQRAGPDRVLAKQELLSDREAWSAGIHKLQGYDPVPLGRVALAAAALSPRQDPATFLVGFADLDLGGLRKALVDAWGVRYAAVAGRTGKSVEGWRVVASGRVQAEFTLRGQAVSELPYVVYENASPLPRAYVLGRAAVLDSRRDAVQQLAALDPRAAVLLEHDVLPPGPRQPFREAAIAQHTATRVTVTAELDAPGYLVLSDTFYPGWSALVDGKPDVILTANLAFRAVPLQPGKHTVNFVYSPRGLKPGAIVTVLTMLAGIGFAIRKQPIRTSRRGE